MNKIKLKNIFSIIIFLILVFQLFIFYMNTQKTNFEFQEKKISIENFSSIIFSNSGVTKIGSEKLDKIDDDNIKLIGKSYLENTKYKIYGENIYINIKDETSYSQNDVEVINSMGVLNASSFESLDRDNKIMFNGQIKFTINE